MADPVPFSEDELYKIHDIIKFLSLTLVDEPTAKRLEALLVPVFPGGSVELTEQKTPDGADTPLFCFRHEGRRAFIR